MKLLSVNEAREGRESLYGEEIFIHGLLIFSLVNVLIDHWPKLEQLNARNKEIWVHTGNGVFKFDNGVLNKLNRKHVVVRGVVEPNNAIYSDDPGLWWSPHICAYALTSYNLWRKEHGATKT